uniref:Methyltransferase FkbM domain-containing protein n=1 Tax=Ditylenchus dipsaci TaxID=166011 RepID=A0A915E3V7_9BILA
MHCCYLRCSVQTKLDLELLMMEENGSIDKGGISKETRRLGDKSIEILKIDIEGTEVEIIYELLQIDICQI